MSTRAETPAPFPLPPEVVSRYEFCRVLGQGGMGQVVLARDKKLDRKVAIKLLTPDCRSSEDETARSRFEAEARACAQIKHPNVISVFDSGWADANPYIVFEYVEGRDLAREIAQQGTLDETRVLEIADQVLAGLEAAHGVGIIHRDIKPANILIRDDDGRSMLMDFGVAKSTNAGAVRTQTGVILGTLFYIAPEIVAGETPSPAIDLYSLGCSLYEALAGHPPFVAEREFQILEMHLRSEPPPLSQHGVRVSPGVQSVILGALEKQPSNRFASARAMRDAFRAVVRRPGTPQDVRPRTVAARAFPDAPRPGGSTASVTRGARPSGVAVTVRRSSADARTTVTGRRHPWRRVGAAFAALFVTACVSLIAWVVHHRRDAVHPSVAVPMAPRESSLAELAKRLAEQIEDHDPASDLTSLVTTAELFNTSLDLPNRTASAMEDLAHDPCDFRWMAPVVDRSALRRAVRERLGKQCRLEDLDRFRERADEFFTSVEIGADLKVRLYKALVGLQPFDLVFASQHVDPEHRIGDLYRSLVRITHTLDIPEERTSASVLPGTTPWWNGSTQEFVAFRGQMGPWFGAEFGKLFGGAMDDVPKLVAERSASLKPLARPEGGFLTLSARVCLLGPAYWFEVVMGNTAQRLPVVLCQPGTAGWSEAMDGLLSPPERAARQKLPSKNARGQYRTAPMRWGLITARLPSSMVPAGPLSVRVTYRVLPGYNTLERSGTLRAACLRDLDLAVERAR